ncbi:MAG TPA: hypothetical protein VLT32_10645, partial [Candidatus Sulfomarinibacteraceae bacterium]|nr:hypothetical protein [Candidatus Sulfomarinibacteraceae bacterium]
GGKKGSLLDRAKGMFGGGAKAAEGKPAGKAEAAGEAEPEAEEATAEPAAEPEPEAAETDEDERKA